MSRPPLEVADLIRNAGAAFIERNRQCLSWKHIKVLLAIARCRTAALGGRGNRLLHCAAYLESEARDEPSLRMPGIIISFVFSEQRRLVFRAAPR